MTHTHTNIYVQRVLLTGCVEHMERHNLQSVGFGWVDETIVRYIKCEEWLI